MKLTQPQKEFWYIICLKCSCIVNGTMVEPSEIFVGMQVCPECSTQGMCKASRRDLVIPSVCVGR